MVVYYVKSTAHECVSSQSILNQKTFCPLMPSTNIQDMFFDKEALRNDVDYQKINDMVKPYKGTTTLAFIFKEGIAIAVDSRATSGSYIASRTVHKVIRVNNCLLTTMAGGAADCLYWEKRMGAFAKLYEVTNGKRLPVPAAVNYLRNCIVGRRGLSIGTMVCGWDDKGPNIYYLDNDGTMVKGTVFSVGSGSTIAYGLLNSNYRFDMSRDEGLKLARDAIFYATYRDAYSGGFVNLYFMDNNGWQHVGQYDVNGLYEELIENK